MPLSCPIQLLFLNGRGSNSYILPGCPLENSLDPVRPVQTASLDKPTSSGLQGLRRPIGCPCRRRVCRQVCQGNTNCRCVETTEDPQRSKVIRLTSGGEHVNLVACAVSDNLALFFTRVPDLQTHVA